MVAVDRVRYEPVEGADDLFTPEFLSYVVAASDRFSPRIDEIRAKRKAMIDRATREGVLPNQINNVLAFPGILRGALDSKATRITTRMKIAAADAIASLLTEPTPDEIILYALNTDVVPAVAKAVEEAWRTEADSQ